MKLLFLVMLCIPLSLFAPGLITNKHIYIHADPSQVENLDFVFHPVRSQYGTISRSGAYYQVARSTYDVDTRTALIILSEIVIIHNNSTQESVNYSTADSLHARYYFSPLTRLESSSIRLVDGAHYRVSLEESDTHLVLEKIETPLMEQE